MTKAHDDRIIENEKDYGYSIRVGKKLPKNSANLAYVQTPKMKPEENLLINDLSDNIKENGIPATYDTERLMYPDDTFLLRELNGVSRLPSRDIVLTDEFSVPNTSQDEPLPLYYEAEVSGLFDARGERVSPYQGGYLESMPEGIKDYAELTHIEQEDMLYMGDKVSITKLDGAPLDSNMEYKVRLVKSQGEDTPVNACHMYIYTNFRAAEDETFIIHYEKYNEDGSKTGDYTEVLNAYPFFQEISKSNIDDLSSNPKANGEWKNALYNKEFSIIETEDSSFQVYAPSQVIVANSTTRPPHKFKYRVRGDLQAKFSSSNPGEIKIGIAYLNQTVFNIENLSSTLWKLYADEGYRPPYLEFENPHPPLLSSLKSSPSYWEIDLFMPEEHWHDYDVIILTGYGKYDMAAHNDSIRSFIKEGGKVWIDNGGSGNDVLDFENSFMMNVGFSPTIEETGFKSTGDAVNKDMFLNRLYVINDEQLSLGYEQVNPKIIFGAGESIANWNTIVRYSTNEPSIIERAYGRGSVVVSNCGIFRSIHHSENLDIKLAMNAILSFAERKMIDAPWIQDYVYHRDNLFKEEYRGAGGETLYVDDRNDLDGSQIVAKKILSKTTKGALLPYLEKSFYSARGTYEVEVESNNTIAIKNASVEVGSYDEQAQSPITSWNATTTEAIPGWNTTHFAGATPLFEHLSSISQRGTKAVKISAPLGVGGSHAFWSVTSPQLIAGSYKATAWVKTSNTDGITGTGPTIGVYSTTGEQVGIGTPILGTQDWVRIEINFSVSSTQQVDIRIGFVDGNGEGEVTIDFVEVEGIGSVYMTPDNDGMKALYAYAIKPKGEAFNLKSEGFSHADITTYDPLLNATFTIRSFVYAWDNYLGKNMRKYGKYISYKRQIRRSDGVVSMGSLSTLIPELPGGADWADSNDIYYEILLGDEMGIDNESQFINLEIYDTERGEYFYNQDGRFVIRHTDLFYGGENKDVLVQARTDYYTIRATKRRYGVKIQDKNKIEIAYPSTIDNRDAWYMRIRNGSFTKRELTYEDIKDLLMYDNRYYEFQQRVFGTHFYALPEYNRQVFKPFKGIRRKRKETAEYINDSTIKVQSSPIYIQEGTIEGELLNPIDDDRRIFKANHAEWIKKEPVRIYGDQDYDGQYAEIISGFDIDYSNGCIVFEHSQDRNIKADYGYDNLQVFSRRYNNRRIRREQLENVDGKTFISKHENWMAYPTPIVRIIPYGSESEENIAAVDAFTIDYESGVVTFKEEMHDRVFVDYTFSTDRELRVKDTDVQNGYIYLDEPVDFRDEIYVNYYYEEEYVEYRGYYNEEIGRFIHLDLNPSAGHYSTLPVVYKDDDGLSFTTYEQVPTAKLMNKEVYIYLLPYKDSFGNRNPHTIRHCYSLKEWQYVQKTLPTAMLLGVVRLREHTSVQETTVMDTRVRGGGLKENISDKEIKRRDPISKNYWDMNTWDGKAYYKNGTIIVEVPKRILQSEGGQFTEKRVRDIVRKHIAYGVYFMIDFI